MDDHDLLTVISEKTSRIESMLEGGKETFKEHDERLRQLEQNQSKIMTIVLSVGAIITLVVNAFIHLSGKIWK